MDIVSGESSGNSLQSTYPLPSDPSRSAAYRNLQASTNELRVKKHGESLHVPDLEFFFPNSMSISKPQNSCSRELPVLCSTVPARHSSASASAVSPNRYGRRIMHENSGTFPVAPEMQGVDVGNSFRSEDSRDRESLALWEEKDCQSERLGIKSRWVKKLESLSQVVVSNKQVSWSPWRNSPMHALRGFDSPRSSIDRKPRSPWRDLVGSNARSKASDVSTHDSLIRTSSCSSPRMSSVSYDVESSGYSTTAVVPASKSVLAQSSRLAATCTEVALCNGEANQFGGDRLRNQEREDIKTDPVEGSEVPQQLDIDAAAAESQGNNCRRPSSAIAWDSLNKSPELSPLRAAAAIPFSWEDVPGKPKTIAAATERALARKLSRDGVTRSSPTFSRSSSMKKKSRSMDESMFNESLARIHEASAAVATADQVCRTPGRTFATCGDGDDRSCKSSHRFYYYRRTSSSRQRSSFDAQSSGRLEAGVIDLIAPAAAKFLAWSPASTSPVHANMQKKPVAVPFKWEESPGKPFKEEELAMTRGKPHPLQLPPCLAAPPYQKLQQGSMSQELREQYVNHSMSAPLAGFCTSSADHQGRGGGQTNLPAIQVPPSDSLQGRASSPHSAVSRWSWSPVSDIGFTMTPKFMRKQQQTIKSSRTLSGPVSSSSSPEEEEQRQQQQQPPPRRFSSGEFTNMMIRKRAQAAASFSPTSTLHGPDTDSQIASSLSSDLDASCANATTPRQMCNDSGRSNSNSTMASDIDSFECRDFESSSPANYPLHSPRPFVSSSSSPRDCSPHQILFPPNHYHHPENSRVTRDSSRASATAGSTSPAQTLVKLCKSGSRKLKFLHRQNLGTIHSPEVWSPTLATYYQWNLSSAIEESEALQSSKATIVAATTSPLLQQQQQQEQSEQDLLQSSELQGQHAIQSSENHNREQESRLSYALHLDIKQQMQETAIECCSRLSPNWDFNARLGEKLSASSQSCSNNEGSMSPAYTATLKLLSPPAATATTKIVAKKSKKKLRIKSKVCARWSNSAPKVHVRACFLVLVCNAIKRMLSRTCSKQKRRRKTALVSESKLLYHVDYTLSPTDFHLSKPN